MESAICREKAIKEWKRNWKLDLIESTNPEWRDLFKDLFVTLEKGYDERETIGVMNRVNVESKEKNYKKEQTYNSY